MPHLIARGKYRARLGRTAKDLAAAQRLRHICFFGGEGLDADAFDAGFQHVLIETSGGTLVACCRVNTYRGESIHESYSGQFYDLDKLAGQNVPVFEVGRFCVRPEVNDADVLRVAWGGLAAMVAEKGAGYLIGCTSFPGCDPSRYAAGFAHLAVRHVGPEDQRPVARASETVKLEPGRYEPKAAVQQLPPLLRSYLTMGGWVSDHAVIDRAMGTLHVFTALAVANVPAARAKALRDMAGRA